MAKGKYAKYIQKLEPTGIKGPEYGKKMREPLFFSGRTIPGAQVSVPIQFIMEGGCGWGLGYQIPPGVKAPAGFEFTRDLPHVHDVDEVWLLFGTNPDDNKDLGGEIEFWMGEGEEAEKYIITEPSAILVPAGVVHNPVYYRNVKRPIVSIPILLAPLYSMVRYVELPAAFKK